MCRIEAIRRLEIETKPAALAKERTFGTDQLRIGIASPYPIGQGKAPIGPRQLRREIQYQAVIVRLEPRQRDRPQVLENREPARRIGRPLW